MKREIKFRAWIPDTGWLADGFSIAMDGTEWYDDNGHSWQLSQLELMQYTGLKDKNGKEIYEGDIVSCNDIIVAVTWKDAGFHIITNESQGASIFVQDRAKHFEVIGNIYENPELINK